LGRQASWLILHLPTQAPCCRCQVNSNVRPRSNHRGTPLHKMIASTRPVHEAQKPTFLWALAPFLVAQVLSAFFLLWPWSYNRNAPFEQLASVILIYLASSALPTLSFGIAMRAGTQLRWRSLAGVVALCLFILLSGLAVAATYALCVRLITALALQGHLENIELTSVIAGSAASVQLACLVALVLYGIKSRRSARLARVALRTTSV